MFRLRSAVVPVVAAALAVVVSAACGGGSEEATSPPPFAAAPWPSALPADAVARWTVEVERRVDHDDEAFTQGLLSFEGRWFESTRGLPTIRELDPEDGRVLRQLDLPADFDAEGLAVVGGDDPELVLLSETLGRARRVGLDDFSPRGEHTYDGVGWGVCHDGDRFVTSDGTAMLTLRSTTTFDSTGSVEVRLDGSPVDRLNELECVDGFVIANRWGLDELVVIEPASGEVRAVVDASSLREGLDLRSDLEVLNGVADLGDGTLLLGGKNWPTIHVVRLVVESVG